MVEGTGLDDLRLLRKFQNPQVNLRLFRFQTFAFLGETRRFAVAKTVAEGDRFAGLKTVCVPG